MLIETHICGWMMSLILQDIFQIMKKRSIRKSKWGKAERHANYRDL